MADDDDDDDNDDDDNIDEVQIKHHRVPKALIYSNVVPNSTYSGTPLQGIRLKGKARL